MIELIFAIVVIAITVLSLPMMTQVTSKGTEDALVQEVIFAAAAELNQAVSYHWDANSIDTNASLAGVINTSGDCNATATKPSHVRLGHAARRCVNDLNATVANAVIANRPSVNDAAHAAQSIFIDTSNVEDAVTGYKHAAYRSTLTVTHGAAFGGANANDVKQVAITIDDGEATPKTITTLETYIFNIGDYDPVKRTF
jgi:hypothetical protein